MGAADGAGDRDTLLWTYFYAIVLYALLGLIAPGGYSPMQSVLATVCEPVLRPFRRLIPSVAGLDLSPLWACIAIQAILILLLPSIACWARDGRDDYDRNADLRSQRRPLDDLFAGFSASARCMNAATRYMKQPLAFNRTAEWEHRRAS